jgi:hypothetical protein
MGDAVDGRLVLDAFGGDAGDQDVAVDQRSQNPRSLSP